MNDSKPDGETLVLLQRWHGGDRDALNVLLERNLDWIRDRVRQRAGPGLRAKGETQDFVQEAFVDILRNGPKFLIENQAHFRALMARIIENVLRDQHAHFHAQRRRVDREQAVPTDSVLALDAGARSITRPSEAAVRGEVQMWIQLGMEYLDPEDRQVVQLRQYEERSFAEIAKELGIAEDAARMRFNRALGRLANRVKELKDGSLFGGA